MANTMMRYGGSAGMMPLRDAMDRLFQDAFTWPSMGDRGMSGTGRWSLPSALFETADAYVFQVALPGVAADSLEITTQQSALTLKGVYSSAVPRDSRGIWTSLPTGEFVYEFNMPGEFDSAAVNAEYHDGLLTLTLPKAAHARVHTIKVTGGDPHKA
jgi:HSP20 family protein